MEMIETLVGNPQPFGATVTDGGVNFAVFSRNGTSVTLCLFESQDDIEPKAKIVLDPESNRTGDVWHVFVPGLKAGALYLYSVDGPFDPVQGHRFNPNDYLIDPYGKALTDTSIFDNLPENYKAPVDKSDIELFKAERKNNFPKCVVIDDNDFDWEGDKPINRPQSESIIYETHLKGYTASPTSQVGQDKAGTYAGFMEKIPYLKKLGINAVEFMPVFEFDTCENGNVNPRTGDRLVNYWGYSTINFFSPKASYAAGKEPGACVNEFKALVKEMHKNGLEVILDVVYNHTAEGNEHGVSLSFRGFENSVYYSLVGNHKEYYMNFSGCGNSMNCNHPIVRKFIIDSLRYWVCQYHVDGFRFDLASILSRSQEGALLNFPPVLNEIAEDPILANTKIIAEPWDAAGAYQLGGFPGGRWSEWNDRFRDEIRRFWRGDEHLSSGAATRIAGSSDLFAMSGRKPWNSINYVTSHDGFTLNDLVSYNGKHNDENGEENRDGSDNNWSYNHGYEGMTRNPQIERTRNRQVKNYILTTLISQGTPMLLAGDEFRRTQNGNNNAYCQDNELSWVNWDTARENDRMVTFTRRAIALRKFHPVFRRNDFFKGVSDLRWYSSDGSNPDWNTISRFLAFNLLGNTLVREDGKPENDFFVVANPDRQSIMVTLPTLQNGLKWYRVADTSIEADDSIVEEGNAEQLRAQERYVVPADSLVILIAQ